MMNSRNIFREEFTDFTVHRFFLHGSKKSNEFVRCQFPFSGQICDWIQTVWSGIFAYERQSGVIL